MESFHVKVLAGLVALSLGASACSVSRQRQAADETPDAATDAVADAMIDTQTDAAVPDDAAQPDLPADASAMDVVLAFEQLLVRRCTCDAEGSCADAWNEQFDGANKACVTEAIDQAGVTACAANGVRELAACWYGADCRGCPAAELTEDTPLADLVEKACTGEQTSAYRAALSATVNCTR